MESKNGQLPVGALIAVIVVAMLILMGGWWGGNKYYLQPVKATNEARATSDAVALYAGIRETAVAQHVKATVEVTIQPPFHLPELYSRG